MTATTLARLQAIADRMAQDFPLHRWGRRVPVRVAVASECMEEQIVTSCGVAHVHPALYDQEEEARPVLVHVAPYYVSSLSVDGPVDHSHGYVPDPIDIMAECWALAHKPRYGIGKRAWRIARFAASYRQAVSP